jgi:hypothetical protein
VANVLGLYADTMFMFLAGYFARRSLAHRTAAQF